LLVGPEDRRLARVHERQPNVVRRWLASDSRAIAESLHQRFDRGYKAEVIQDQWSKLRRNASHRRDGLPQQFTHPSELRRQLRIVVTDSLAYPNDHHPQRGERLAQLIVQLA